MTYTEWYPPEIKPARKGLYLIKSTPRSGCWHVGYWNSDGWYEAESANNGRCTGAHSLEGSSHNYFYWRGLTKNHGSKS